MNEHEALKAIRLAISENRFAGGADYAFADIEKILQATIDPPLGGELLTADDTLSDAAFLDECAMRAMQALVPQVITRDNAEGIPQMIPQWVGALAFASYKVAADMLAERKRRREGV